jgi:hypothetical protein
MKAHGTVNDILLIAHTQTKEVRALSSGMANLEEPVREHLLMINRIHRKK